MPTWAETQESACSKRHLRSTQGAHQRDPKVEIPELDQKPDWGAPFGAEKKASFFVMGQLA